MKYTGADVAQPNTKLNNVAIQFLGAQHLPPESHIHSNMPFYIFTGE